MNNTTDEAHARFAQLLTHKNTVFLICLGFTQNRQDAEDLTQDSYVKAYLKQEGIKNQSSQKEWLFQIARNTCLDHLRRKANPVNAVVDISEPQMENCTAIGITPEHTAVTKQQFELLGAAVQSLPPKQREVFVMKEYADLSYRDIALIIGVRDGTVMSRLNRARKALTDRFKHLEKEPLK